MELHDIAIVLAEHETTGETTKLHATSPRSLVDALTADVFRSLLESLPLADQARLSATCRRARRHVLDAWSAVQHVVQPSHGLHSCSSSSSSISSSSSSSSLLPSPSPLLPLQHMVNLCDIDVSGGGASDELLTLLGRHTPRLARVSVARSPHVTHAGLQALAAGCPLLAFVDITFCPRTDYGAVFILRGDPGPDAPSFTPRPVVVRRQLPWQDGHFYCPWEPPEIHTYYPDGAFQFSREVESRGWVVHLEERDGHLADRLRYTNLDLPPGFDQAYFLPGVLLQQDRPGEVLIVQSRNNLRPPDVFPDDDAAGTLSALPVGRSTTFGPPDDPLLVSRMRVDPLGPHDQLCPDDLLFFNRAFYYAHPTMQRYHLHNTDHIAQFLSDMFA